MEIIGGMNVIDAIISGTLLKQIQRYARH